MRAGLNPLEFGASLTTVDFRDYSGLTRLNPLEFGASLTTAEVAPEVAAAVLIPSNSGLV